MAGGSLSCTRAARIVALALAILLLPAAALAQQRAPLDAASSALVEQLVRERAAAIAAIEGRIGEREASLITLLQTDRRRIEVALASARRARAEEAGLRAQAAQIDADMRALIEHVGTSDGRFGAEIAEYRRQITAIAGSDDPRQREALARYAHGDRRGGFAALVALQEADTRAMAAGWAEIAALADDMKDRGEMPAREVVRLYETVVRLDPRHVGGWLAISNLARDLGDIDRAVRAAEQARDVAGEDDRPLRARALQAIAAAQRQRGDGLAAGWSMSEAGNSLRTDLSFNHMPIGRDERLLQAHQLYAEAGGNLDAMRNLMTVTVILRRMGEARESDLADALIDLAERQIELGFASAARANADEGLEISRRLASERNGSLLRRRELISALTTAARAAVSTNDRAGQTRFLNEALELARALHAEQPESMSVLNLYGWLAERAGHAELAIGNSATGTAALEEAVAARRLAAGADANRGLARTRLAYALAALARLPGRQSNWTEAAALFEGLDRTNQLDSLGDDVGYEAVDSAAILERVEALMAPARADPADLDLQAETVERLQQAFLEARRPSGSKIAAVAAIECLRRILAAAQQGSREREDALESLRYWLLLYGNIEWEENVHYWDTAALRIALQEAVDLRRSSADAAELLQVLAAHDLQTGRLADARRNAERSVAELRALSAGDQDVSYALANGLKKLAEIALRMDDARAALAAASEFVALERARLERSPPDSTLGWMTLADGLRLLARAQRRTNDFAAALASSSEEAQLRQRHADFLNVGGPTDLFAADHMLALMAVGDAERGRRRYAEARQAYEQSIALARSHDWHWEEASLLQRLSMLPGLEAQLEGARARALIQLNLDGRGPRDLLETLFPPALLAQMAEPEFGAQSYYSERGHAAIVQNDLGAARGHFEAEIDAARREVAAYPRQGLSHVSLGAALADMAILERLVGNQSAASARTQESQQAYSRALDFEEETGFNAGAIRQAIDTRRQLAAMRDSPSYRATVAAMQAPEQQQEPQPSDSK